MNITQAISAVAKRQPQAVAIRVRRQDMSYAELDAAVARLAAMLAERGISKGDVVAIAMGTAPLHLLSILALARLGAVSVSLPPRAPAPERRELARRFGVKLAIETDAAHGIEGVPSLTLTRGWQRADAADSAPPAKVADTAPWRIALSSGTTGSPKAMLLEHGDMIDYARVNSALTPGGAGVGTRLLCFRGIDSNVLLRPALRQLLCGGAVVFSTSITPQAMIAALRHNEVTHASMPPPLLGAVCELLGDNGPHFPRLIQLSVSGARLAPALFEQALRKVTPYVYSNYGASEVGLIAVSDPGLLRVRPDAAGRLASGLEVQAVDKDDRPVAAGDVGALRFRGPGVVKAYHLDPETTARCFRRGWFYSGDTGRIDEGGLLFLDGRTDDRINFGGTKINPDEIERVIETHPQVVEAAVFHLRPDDGPEALCAAVVLRTELPSKVLAEHCRSKLKASRVPSRFVSVRKLPRNDNGKLVRSELPKLLEARKAGGRGNAPN